VYGWMGNVLRVDLSKQKVSTEELDPVVCREYIGGRGFNSRTLFKEIKPGIDPLGPENVVCLATGPFTASGLTSCSRVEVSTLSPYSGILGDGNAGGSFAHFLKKAGYDQIIICGKAQKPLYLWIEDGNVELRDASDLMGLSTWETADILYERHGKDISVAAIGQGGENLVRFATVMFDKYNSAARGSGAVLGSKRLKAIAVRGTKSVSLADPDEFRELAREDRDFFLNDPFQKEVVAVYGSHIGMLHWAPGFRNYEKYLSEADVPEALKPEAWKQFETGRSACRSCVVPCKNSFRIPEGEYEGEAGKALEYECIFCLGTNCGITEPVPIMVQENLADKYGICVIALGNAIAMAKELYMRGILTERDTGGLTLDWEDAETQIELVHRTALRQGFGNLVAEGMYSMAKILGNGAMDYCYHVKGLSRGPYPAGVFGLSHATSTRGADHLRGRSWAYGENDMSLWPELVENGHIPVEDEVKTLILSEQVTTLTDMIGRCKGAVNNWASAVPLVSRYPLLEGVARLLGAATGMEFSEEILKNAADRVYLLEMAFNVRQGIRKEHARLPLKPGLAGTQAGDLELAKHEVMLDKYHTLRGCKPETGVPTREKLESLGLGFVADELEKVPENPGSFGEWDGPVLWDLKAYPKGTRRA